MTRPLRREPRTTTAATAVATVLATLALGLAVNARQIEQTVERQPYGPGRETALDLVRPLRRTADALWFTLPRRALDAMVGRDDGGDVLAPPGDPPTLPPPTTTPAAPPTTGVPTGPPSTAPTTTTTVPALRRPTAEAPLRLWIGGDSQIGVPGQSLQRLAGTTGLITTELDVRISTGLARPDAFDWPAHLAEALPAWAPDAVVVQFGANDHQGVRTPDGWLAFRTDAWAAEYRARVDAVMTLLERQAARVYWLGQPIARDDGYSARLEVLNALYAEVASRHPQVEFIPIWALLATADGTYASHLPDAFGREVRVRADDGIHLSRAGGDLVAKVVLDAVVADWGLGS